MSKTDVKMTIGARNTYITVKKYIILLLAEVMENIGKSH